VPLPDGLHLGELLQERVVVLEALLISTGRSPLARQVAGVRVRKGDGVGLVGAVELHLAGGRVVSPEREVDGLNHHLRTKSIACLRA